MKKFPRSYLNKIRIMLIDLKRYEPIRVYTTPLKAVREYKLIRSSVSLYPWMDATYRRVVWEEKAKIDQLPHPDH